MPDFDLLEDSYDGALVIAEDEDINTLTKEEKVKLSWSSLPALRWWQCQGEMKPGPRVENWPGGWQAQHKIHTEDILTFR